VTATIAPRCRFASLRQHQRAGQRSPHKPAPPITLTLGLNGKISS